MNQNEILQNPRIIVVQKLYTHQLNKDSEITFQNTNIENL